MLPTDACAAAPSSSSSLSSPCIHAAESTALGPGFDGVSLSPARRRAAGARRPRPGSSSSDWPFSASSASSAQQGGAHDVWVAFYPPVGWSLAALGL
eukprot:scaffold104206_cov39-Phaeocystis_antarctica.AAC.1